MPTIELRDIVTDLDRAAVLALRRAQVRSTSTRLGKRDRLRLLQGEALRHGRTDFVGMFRLAHVLELSLAQIDQGHRLR